MTNFNELRYCLREIIGIFMFVDSVQAAFAVGSSMSCSTKAKDSCLQTV